LIEGLALIQRQLAAELEAEGLRPMESVGELFDPERHEAVATDPEAPVPPHTVTQVFQRGYFLHDRVLRPAMVRVRVDESEGSAARRERKES
jgi:molecular chaperone GrpE